MVQNREVERGKFDRRAVQNWEGNGEVQRCELASVTGQNWEVEWHSIVR
jgi:hypothetical protein